MHTFLNMHVIMAVCICTLVGILSDTETTHRGRYVCKRAGVLNSLFVMANVHVSKIESTDSLIYKGARVFARCALSSRYFARYIA